MKINIKVPTGNICTLIGEHGKELEFLSIGDYGKEKNVKADFLGLTKEINGVEHCKLLPLEEKWVITISSQYGCSMGCKFCDAPKVGAGYNATFHDLINQVNKGISLHPEVKNTKRLNLHYARMGEPTFNRDVINSAYYLSAQMKANNFGFHPVVSTMMPYSNVDLCDFIVNWLIFKNNVEGEAGLQISINTTDRVFRHFTMPCSSSLAKISSDMETAIERLGGVVKGRKITLNFALTDAEIDANILRKLFDPKYFICKLTPMHMTTACKDLGIKTENGYTAFYPYKDVEKRLKASGFDVIVFIPSIEEDESRITCGNVILSDRKIK